MVVIMTNDCVIVYDIDDKSFERFIATPNVNLGSLDKYKVYEVSKVAYSPNKMLSQVGEKLLNVGSYYYDNGIKLVKKPIHDIDDIKYYADENGELWVSREYSKTVNNNASINLQQAELIALDHDLNSCEHIENLLPPHRIEEFKRLYSTELYRHKKASHLEHITADYVLDSFYEVESYCKLIMRKNNTKMTSSQLEGNVFVTVAPAGIGANNEMKYFIEEYKITSQDILEINNIFRRYLREDHIKVASLTEKEKYLYFDRAVREYKQKLIGELERVSTKSKLIVNGHTKTWTLFKAEFFKKYGYPVEDFNDSWASFDKITLDARTIHNGYIVPITIESYQRESSKSSSKKVEQEDTREMSASKLIKPSYIQPSEGDKDRLDILKDKYLAPDGTYWNSIEQYQAKLAYDRAMATLNPKMPSNLENTSLVPADLYSMPLKDSFSDATKESTDDDVLATPDIVTEMPSDETDVTSEEEDDLFAIPDTMDEEPVTVLDNAPEESVGNDVLATPDTVTEIPGDETDVTSEEEDDLFAIPDTMDEEPVTVLDNAPEESVGNDVLATPDAVTEIPDDETDVTSEEEDDLFAIPDTMDEEPVTVLDNAPEESVGNDVLATPDTVTEIPGDEADVTSEEEDDLFAIPDIRDDMPINVSFDESKDDDLFVPPGEIKKSSIKSASDDSSLIADITQNYEKIKKNLDMANSLFESKIKVSIFDSSSEFIPYIVYSAHRTYDKLEKMLAIMEKKEHELISDQGRLRDYDLVLSKQYLEFSEMILSDTQEFVDIIDQNNNSIWKKH